MFSLINKTPYWALLVALSIFIMSCEKDNGDEPAKQASFERVISFGATSAEQPHGIISLDDGSVLVSFPFLNELRIYNPATGALIKTITNTPALSFMGAKSDGKILLGSFAGLDPAFDADDPSNPSNAPLFANNGVWTYDPATETLSQWAAMTPGTFPTHFAELPNGNVLVSNILGKEIYQIDPAGTVSVWIDDNLLQGDPNDNRPGPEGRPPFPVGIEGIQVVGNNVIGVVADYGRIVSIPINNDGTAGNVSVIKEDQQALLGLAHFVLDDAGDMIAVSGFQSKVFKIQLSTDVSVEVLADNQSSVIVDTPSQITRGKSTQIDELFFVNFALIRNSDKQAPAPGITRIKDAL